MVVNSIGIAPHQNSWEFVETVNRLSLEPRLEQLMTTIRRLASIATAEKWTYWNVCIEEKPHSYGKIASQYLDRALRSMNRSVLPILLIVVLLRILQCVERLMMMIEVTDTILKAYCKYMWDHTFVLTFLLLFMIATSVYRKKICFELIFFVKYLIFTIFFLVHYQALVHYINMGTNHIEWFV